MKAHRLMLKTVIVLVCGWSGIACAQSINSQTNTTTQTTNATAAAVTDTTTAATQDSGGAIATSGQKEIQGEVSAIGKGYISIVYERDTAKGIEYEMMLPLDENIQFQHKKSLKEFAIGDTVKVRFEDATEEDNAKVQHLKRKARVISFVSSAAPTPPGSSAQ
ncbi:MAG: hypothetical protein HY209_06130 [Candidatus Omnitrophica bacterium]|nr:hypothetical protein [Candidatus Omnitrophota bacterium]